MTTKEVGGEPSVAVDIGFHHELVGCSSSSARHDGQVIDGVLLD
jgi:hypothetical protein